MNLTSISKFLALVLRHKPEEIGLKLDEHGWAFVPELIEKLNNHKCPITIQLLEQIVREDNKKRYSFNEGKTSIRANQGHSLNVDLELKTSTPPDTLYHGTSKPSLSSILAEGLKKMSRQHVHLSADMKTALIVGSRRQEPMVLTIDAKGMSDSGYKFYLSENYVWLTDAVPPEFISLRPRNESEFCPNCGRWIDCEQQNCFCPNCGRSWNASGK